MLVIFDSARGRKNFRLINSEPSAFVPATGRAVALEGVIRNR